MHSRAVVHSIAKVRDYYESKEDRLLRNIAWGNEVDPSAISPRLVEVQPDTEDELLFRYAKLHWSIPVSAGYGRRLRFLVKDTSNGRLIGLFGLADPVCALTGRDKWIGWTQDQRDKHLSHVMDAFVLGSVPPYSYLLGGKLTAMLVASDEVRRAFARKYQGHVSVIRKRNFDGRLALVTTTSALGKSALYDRIRFGDRELFHSVGFTEGWGEFHFSDGVYKALFDYASRYCDATRRHRLWGGDGFRNKREVVLKCLPKLGLPKDWLNHGVKREIFVIPLAKNTQEFLQGKRERLHWYHQSADELFRYFRNRWLLPRSLRDTRWSAWDPQVWRLFPHEN